MSAPLRDFTGRLLVRHGGLVEYQDDGLVAVVHNGQNWGFPGCYGQVTEACRNVPSPVGVLDAHAAAGGVAFLGSSALVAEWQSGKVLRVSVDGKTGNVSTFLTGIQSPLPIVTTTSGAILVGDWSTGRIYRVTV